MTEIDRIRTDLVDIIELIRDDRKQPGLDPLQTLAAVEIRLAAVAGVAHEVVDTP